MFRKVKCKLGFHSMYFIEPLKEFRSLYRCFDCGLEEKRELPVVNVKKNSNDKM